MLKAGQALLLNNRRWHLRQVQPIEARNLELEVIGASEASLGMTRRLTTVRYGDDLFIEQRRHRYCYANLRQDWVEDKHGPALNCKPATWLDLLAVHTRHPSRGDLKNKFSWSYSRSTRYRRCPRAYYYHYYAAWDGWQKNAPRPVKRAYLLKNLTGLSRWVGNLVHESLKFALARFKAGQVVAETELVKQMRRRAQVDFDDSHSGRYRQQPKQLTGFQEHYYQIALPKNAWQVAWTKAEHYLRTFINSALYANLRRQPVATFLDVEELQSFTLAGAKVWVKMDLARWENGVVYLYDWKTGPVDGQEVRQQLGLYGLYVRHACPGVAGAGVSLRGIVYALAEDRLLEFDLDEAVLQQAQAMAETSIAHLRGLLLDAEVNLAELRRFPMIDDWDICRSCQFRELCGRDK